MVVFGVVLGEDEGEEVDALCVASLVVADVVGGYNKGDGGAECADDEAEGGGKHIELRVTSYELRSVRVGVRVAPLGW